MSYRDALKVFKLERGLTDDETAFLNTLRTMSDSERELLVESLSPEKPVKKKSTERHIEHCVACNYTKRAIHHKDTTHKDYHEFQSPSAQKKSKRAASISDAIKGTAGVVGKVVETDEHICCVALVDDNGGEMPCGLSPDANVHHLSSDPDYHPFESSSDARPASGKSSSKNGEGAKSAASSETETKGAGTAHRAAS